ncbi:MAG: ribulose-phosphate 3-epimerase [Thermoplasmata archaeon]|nr:ribulose-phosphate 3-epimerase [Thermoplasmata archaeon]
MLSGERPLRLAPSLLSADFAALGEAVRVVEEGGADALHLDVMDGHFVSMISFGPLLVQAVRRSTKLPLDVHLMVESPERHVEAFARAGGTTLVFHLEATREPAALALKIRELGAFAGVAIRPDTPLALAAPLLDRIDELLVMSVHPGFSGQSFLAEALPKIAAARKHLDDLGLPVELSVDGGITPETAVDAAAAGARFFVCGNSVFAHGDPRENLRTLRRSVDEGARRAVR